MLDIINIMNLLSNSVNIIKSIFCISNTVKHNKDIVKYNKIVKIVHTHNKT